MGNTPGKQRPSKYVHWDTAVTPAPPGKPHLVPGTPHTQPDVVTIRWEPPVNDGGAPVTGYLVEHRRTGSPHWVRATPSVVPIPELTLSGLEPGWRYQFRVSAQNVVGLSEPGDVSEPLTVTLNRSSTAAPYFLQELHDVVALENDTAEFRVVFRGNPAPKISWYKDGFEIFSSRRMRVVTEGDHSALIIYQTGFSDEGDIKCTATNRAGHLVTKARLRLEAPPRVRLPRQYEEGLLFELGEVIRLKVSVAGRPLPRVTWYHNGEPVTFGGRYEVMNTERASALRVAEARRGDRGEYQVRATSRLGEDQANFLVTVTDRPTPPGRAKVISAEGRIVKLSWTEPDDDGGCKIGNYIVEYYRIGWNVWLKAATCRQLSTALEELIEGSEYKFRVKAENPYGVSDPSEESQVVFIPDPRRGLLEPPARKKAAGARSATLPADASKRKEPSHHAALPPAKKVQGRGWETRDRPLPVISFDRVEVLDGSTEKKRKDVDDAPPPVPPKTLRRANRVDGQPLPPHRQKAATLPVGGSLPEPQQEPLSEAPAGPKVKVVPAAGGTRARAVQGAQQQGDTKVKVKTEPPAASRSQAALPHQSPLTPREEDDSLLHGSSELMLVLLPQSSVEGEDEEEGAEPPTKEEEEEEKRRERAAAFGQDGLQEGVAPPLSLSAPELGSGEPPFPALRNAVSSTELLHERAMARFYQAVAAEEAAKALERRRSIEGALPPAAPSTPRPRGASLSDEEEIRRVLRPRLPVSLAHAQQQEPPTPPLTQTQARPRPPSPVAPRPPPPRSPPPPALPSQRSEEEEEADGFARLRDRLRDAPGGRLARRAPPPRLDSDESHDSDADAYLTGLSGEVSGDASIDLEDEEPLEEPEEEPEEELEEEPEEEPEPVERRPLLRSRYSEDDEELEEAVEAETYHPRSMVPRAVVESPVAVGTAPLAQPERSPPSLRPGAPSALARTALPEEPPPPVPPHARSPLPTPPITAPKPILKKPRSPSPEQAVSPPTRSPLSRSPPLSPSRSPPLSPRSRSPLLNSRLPRSPSPRSPSPSSPTPSTPLSSPRPFSPISRSPFFARSLQGMSPPTSPPPREFSPPSRPFSPPLLPADDPEMERRLRRSPAPAPEIPAAPESTPISRRQSRQASLEEEEAITLRAVSDLYGDIIQRHARGPRPKKLYINTAELKAAAEHQPRPLLPPKPAAPAPKVPPPPKPKEPEPLPTPPPPPAPTLFERLGSLWVWVTGADEESYSDPEEQTKKKPVKKSKEESEDEYEEEDEEAKEEEPPAKAPAPVPKKAPPAPIPRLVRSVTPPPTLMRDPIPTPVTPAVESRTDAEDAPADTLDDVTREAPAAEPTAPATERLPPVRPLSPEEEEAIRKVTEKKVRSTIEYLTDVAMFSVACWLYVFGDELYAVPVLLLMVYRQLRDAIHSRIPRFLRRSSS